MNSIGLALTAIMFLLLAAFMAPNILAMNRGKILRNIAIWLAVFLALGIVYKAMHPQGSPPLVTRAPPAATKHEGAAPPHDNNDGNEGFTPPKEE